MTLREIVIALVLLGGAVGCKQGQGDRCQIDDDCASGLICVYPGAPDPLVGGECLRQGGEGIDAASTNCDGGPCPIDAPPVDAGLSDGGPDAPASIDAATPIDAAETD